MRLGITDPKTFIKKRFKSEPLTYLNTCCAGAGTKDQIEACVEETLAEESWADIMVCTVWLGYGEGRGGQIEACVEETLAEESLADIMVEYLA